MMATFTEMEDIGRAIGVDQIFLGVASFFTVAFGGLFIGILVGFLTALITKTTREVRVMEPLALFGMAYLAYFAAELFHWSGIISLIGCGLIQSHYAFNNTSQKSQTTVKYFIKMASSLSDIIIFLFLGVALIKNIETDDKASWNVGFIVWSLCFCLIARFLTIYGLVWICNRYRVKQINLQEQFIMAYGGLRGAVGFSLVEMISDDHVEPKSIFVNTTLVIVMFTIFIQVSLDIFLSCVRCTYTLHFSNQGGTIKYLVDLLNIDKKKEEGNSISEEVNDNVMEHIMSGIDVISGKRGKQYFQVCTQIIQ